MIDKKIDPKLLMQIEGFSDTDMIAAFDVILRYHEPKTALEIGVWHGRTAAHMAAYVEDIVIVDNDMMMLTDTVNYIGQINPNLAVKPICSRSDELTEHDFEKRFDIIHIDGRHTQSAVLSDMRLASKLLTRRGIMILDDVFNHRYPQITEAMYTFLRLNPEYTLLLVGFNKGIICKKEEYTNWSRFIIAGFMPTLRQYPLHEDEKHIFYVYKSSSYADCLTFGVGWSGKSEDLAGVVGCDDDNQKFEMIIDSKPPQMENEAPEKKDE